MKRPLCLCALSLVTGILTAYLTHSALFILLGMLILVFAIAVIYAYSRDNLPILTCIVLFYSLGAIRFLYLDNINTSKYADFAGKQVRIKGFVDSEPDIRDWKVSYFVKTEEITPLDGEDKNENAGIKYEGTDAAGLDTSPHHKGSSRKVNGRILLTTPKKDDMNLLDYGQGIEITGTLKLPKGARNPGGFDYRRYLAISGTYATVFALDHNITGNMTVRHVNPLVKMGLAIKRRMVDTIDKSLPPEQAGLLNGMMIGYRGGLTRDAEAFFSDAGLSHIMAASGMNVAFIAFPLLFILKKLRTEPRAANVITIVALILFLFVTGFQPSILRAVIMTVVILSAQVIRREAEIFSSISLASILMLAWNPYMLFDIGFQLSFAATISLVLFYKRIREFMNFKFLPPFMAEIIACTLAAQVGVLPISVYYFNKISLVSIFTNILVVPFVQLITVIGFAMAVLGQINMVLSQLLGYINYIFLTFILLVTKISAKIPYGVVRVVTPPVMVLVLYYLLVILFFYRRSLGNLYLSGNRYLKPILLAIMFCATAVMIFAVFTPRNLKVIFIDVGQGDSALIKTSWGRTVLIDGGGKNRNLESEADTGEMIVIPLLLDERVSKLDLVVATHGHDDHMEGLMTVLKEFRTSALVIPDCDENKELKELVEIAKKRNIPVKACGAGDSIILDANTSLSVLHPQRTVYLDNPLVINNPLIINNPAVGNKSPNSNNSVVNNNSLVLKLTYKDLDVLFTGDIEKEAEGILVDSGADLEADVLKVAHHGSITSTSDFFLNKVIPKAAIISVGSNNFGHPSDIVLERLRSSRTAVYRTDEHGAVILTSDGKRFRIKTMFQ